MVLKFLPNDYIIDGFVFVNNRHIEDIRAFEENDLTVKVLKLKGIDFNEKTEFELNSYQKFFNSFKNELIQISTYDKNITYVGRIIKVNEKSFRFKMLRIDPRHKEIQDTSPLNELPDFLPNGNGTFEIYFKIQYNGRKYPLFHEKSAETKK